MRGRSPSFVFASRARTPFDGGSPIESRARASHRISGASHRFSGIGLLIAVLAGSSVHCRGARFVAVAEEREAVDGLYAPEPVAFTPADDLLAAPTSDGRYVVFVSEQNGNLDLWVRDYATNSTFPSTLNVADDFDPAVSDDGARIAFVSRRDDAKGDIYLSDDLEFADDAERLTGPESSDRQPVFSRDGRTLYYTSAVGLGPEYVMAMDLDTGTRTRLSPTPGFDPAVSRDGRFIIYTKPSAEEFVDSGLSRANGGRRVEPASAGRLPGTEQTGKKHPADLEGADPLLDDLGGESIGDRRGDGSAYPRLIALRLVDGATRAITLGDAPEGFATFLPEPAGPLGPHSIAYVRFPDDDNQDGRLDGHDHASLWRLSLDLDQAFEVAPQREESWERVARGALGAGTGGRVGPRRFHPAPVPLTDGASEELFPAAAGGFIYFTQGKIQQDIARLPVGGMFPEYEDPARYLDLARVTKDRRTRLFVLRSLLARTDPGTDLHAAAELEAGTLALEDDRTDIARRSFESLAEVEVAPEDRSTRAVTVGLATVELLSLDRIDGQRRRPEGSARDEVLHRVSTRLKDVAKRFAWSSAVIARVNLEEAELTFARKDRAKAIAILDEVLKNHPDESHACARAMMRRTELLQVAYDPDAVGEAYGAILRSFPNEAEVVRDAAAALIEAELASIHRTADGRESVDLLRRLVARSGDSPVGRAARERLAAILEARGALRDAAIELERLSEESRDDPLGRAMALEALARVEESSGALDEAESHLVELRQEAASLPGFAMRARDAITRVNLERARRAEREGRLPVAREAYRGVIENDFTQVKAHRRYLALSAELGAIDGVIEEARHRRALSPRTPTVHYVYGLALTWADPPRLDEALEAIERAIALNPQLTHAYLTRGWIREMQELERPGFFASIVGGVGAFLGRALGSIFEVEVQRETNLTRATLDYRTALRLNPEAIDPETEAEASLDLANAQYRIAEATEDLSNMRGAFERYVEVMKLGFRFRSEIMELVYWERFGRSAAWAGEWATSAMATRRAVSLAERLGRSDRLPQLRGNLALAYAAAGERAYGDEALVGFEEALGVSKTSSRLAIARRESARAKLADVKDLSTESMGQVLEALQSARALIDGLESSGVIKTSMWKAIGADNTRAQYGFIPPAELDVNMALAESAHRMLGDTTRADAIRDQRILLTRELIEDRAKVLLFLTRDPVVRNVLRERYGLLAERARMAYDAGDFRTARGVLSTLEREIEDAAGNEEFAASRLALLADLGRVQALFAELSVGASEAIDPEVFVTKDALDALDATLATTLDRIAGASRRTVESSTVAVPAAYEGLLAEVPMDFSSTTAVARTASIAFGRPRLSGDEKDAVAVRARIHHARGLLELGRAHAVLERGSAGRTMASVFAGLDQALMTVKNARAHFEAAAREAVLSSYGLGSRVAALSLHGVWLSTRILHDRSSDVEAALADAARTIARRHGEEELAITFEIVEASRGDPELAESVRSRLLTTHPYLLRESRSAYAAFFSRTASTAMSSGDLTKVFTGIDHLLLLDVAARRPIEIDSVGNPTVREASRALVRRVAALEGARKQVHEIDALMSKEERDRRLVTFERCLRDLGEEKGRGLSASAKLRLFAEPQDIDFIVSEVGPKEAMLVPAPIDGVLHLFLVDGSTTAEQKLLHVETAFDWERVRDDVAALRSALARGTLDEGLVARLREALFAPLAPALRGKDSLIVSSGLLGTVIPQLVALKPGPALVHVSAPSMLEQVRQRQLAGVSGTAVIASPLEPPLVEQADRISPEEALAYRHLSARDRAPPEKGQRLEDRTLGERLSYEERASLVVEARVHVEPGVPERSVIDLGREREGGRRSGREDTRAHASVPHGTKAKDATETPERFIEFERADEGIDPADRLATLSGFERELPLGALRIRARNLVLAEVADTSPGAGPRGISGRDLLSLDLALVERGFATTVVIPDVVPREARARLVRAFLDDANEVGPQEALRRAIDATLPLSPSVALAFLLGSPGLDREGVRAFARAQVKAASVTWQRLVTSGVDGETLVAATERWIRLQIESGEKKDLHLAYDQLVAALEKKMKPPRPDRAVDRQREHLKLLADEEALLPEGRRGPLRRLIANETIDLGRVASAAKDAVLAEAEFAKGLELVKVVGTPEDLGLAYYAYAFHRLDQLDFEGGASYLERAIGIFERAGVYAKPSIPREGVTALRKVGEVYLESLSDPVRAEAAYRRALRYSKGKDEETDAVLDLAHVARRRGAFDDADRLAAEARARAKAKQDRIRELSAVIEAANVAWYRGDYRSGQGYCEESLGMADSLLRGFAQAKANPAKNREAFAVAARDERKVRSRKIFALSVCGVVAMSQRDFERSHRYLSLALAMADSANDEPEIATQENNLGRLYLEFGRLDEAVSAFERAQAIDTRLRARYALAYDLRNLGEALTQRGDSRGAEAALVKGLGFALESKDANNELRARFGLGDLAFRQGDFARAKERFLEALPLAERLRVQELSWKMHHALGLIDRRLGDDTAAERRFRTAMSIARSLTGRASTAGTSATSAGPHRYAAFDALTVLLLDRGREEEALQVADLARSLEDTQIFEDSRISFASARVPALLRAIRETSSSSAASSAMGELEALEPALASMIAPLSLKTDRGQMPPGGAIVMYRITEGELLVFLVDDRGLVVRRQPVTASRLKALVLAYVQMMATRADPTVISRELSSMLLEPVAARLEGKTRVAIVPHKELRYLSFAALPLPSGPSEGTSRPLQLIDRAAIVEAVSPYAAVHALSAPLGTLDALAIEALGGAAVAPGAVDRPLPFSRKEVEVIKEELPRTTVWLGDRVSRGAVLDRLAGSRGVVHFAGHSVLRPGGGSAVEDPLDAELVVSDGAVKTLDVLGVRGRLDLLVLSSCWSTASSGKDSQVGSGDELLALAQTFRLAGAKNVLMATMHVHDLASALVMKRFYRAARGLPAMDALATAQREVRSSYPHPAWWAPHVLVVGR